MQHSELCAKIHNTMSKCNYLTIVLSYRLQEIQNETAVELKTKIPYNNFNYGTLFSLCPCKVSFSNNPAQLAQLANSRLGTLLQEF